MSNVCTIRYFIGLVLAGVIFIGCRDKGIDFSAQVKPILNKHCIACHGGVKRNAKFSLLFRHEALDTAESGKHMIIPGDPEHSEMIRRITSNDPEVRMPYKEEPLSSEEIAILRQWIKEGAQWGDHWAYLPPRPVAVPNSGGVVSGFSAGGEDWVKNEIDYFILKRLEEEDLTPSPEADKATLIRRVYLDVIGLPPTLAQAEKFIKDERPDAYARVVDELLTSPHFGEKWASWWLDMARYSDTKGYEKDAGRTIWRYRDWVIKAFNSDMPFDRFTTEQLAGDLLPNPTDDQLIATAFHRNTMNNDEGGTTDEEFRVAALIDRVGTTWEIWQSTTMQCVQCHTHPYDPFVNEEYYKAMAFFNNTRDEDTPGEHPNLRIYNEEDNLRLEKIKAWVKSNGGVKEEQEVTRFLKTLEPKFHPHDFDQFINGELIDNKFLGIRSGGSARVKQISLEGKTNLIMTYWADAEGGSFEIRRDHIDGAIIAGGKLPKGARAISVPVKPTSGKHDLYITFRNTQIKPDNAVCGVEWFAFRDDLPGKGSKDYEGIKSSFLDLVNATADETPIMIENTAEQHRTTRIFVRGNWLAKGDSVTAGVPKSLNAFPKGQPYNRLGFAAWLLSKENPLTARAIVNRFWEQIFGTGIVESLEDFGTQGAIPTDKELLDWLALRFMNENHWSMKKLVKEMVMSATYRQDSHVSNELLERDPTNNFLARGPRVRLTFEQVRDQALAVSGLLSDKMYGKSVMPYQPAGIWNSVYSNEYWKESEGDDEFRRSVYTYAKRTSPYPSMMMFDGSSREVCVSRRIRTNTPLQALVTLNDSSFVVAARSLAKGMVKQKVQPKEQIRAGYRSILVRDINDQKLDVLEGLYDEALEEYKANKTAATKLAAEKNASPELAAMTIVASALLNL
ncbi:MAG TPA: DUF1553 domain-containing protein, partial [Chryseolinea sp.]|nr:DUF1553 domain-containing protein [Chryseolinea sp.]